MMEEGKRFARLGLFVVVSLCLLAAALFMRLDLPLPDPPRITTISPRCTSKDASSSSTRAP